MRLTATYKGPRSRPSKYDEFYRYRYHGWVPRAECPDSPAGFICGRCLRERNLKQRVATKPRHSNYAGEVVRARKLSLSL